MSRFMDWLNSNQFNQMRIWAGFDTVIKLYVCCYKHLRITPGRNQVKAIIPGSFKTVFSLFLNSQFHCIFTDFFD